MWWLVARLVSCHSDLKGEQIPGHRSQTRQPGSKEAVGPCPAQKPEHQASVLKAARGEALLCTGKARI